MPSSPLPEDFQVDSKGIDVDTSEHFLFYNWRFIIQHSKAVNRKPLESSLHATTEAPTHKNKQSKQIDVDTQLMMMTSISLLEVG